MTYECDTKFREVMGRPIDGTQLHILDLFLLGEAVLNSVGAAVTFGHESPANILSYTPQPTESDHVSQHIVRDLLAWVSGSVELSPGCVSRLAGWVAAEWQPHQIAGVSAQLAEPAAQ